MLRPAAIHVDLIGGDYDGRGMKPLDGGGELGGQAARGRSLGRSRGGREQPDRERRGEEAGETRQTGALAAAPAAWSSGSGVSGLIEQSGPSRSHRPAISAMALRARPARASGV